MKIDIWSDVRCPFCYIGKHKFEKALEQFPQKKEINVEWHSFELDPGLKTDPSVNTFEHLAKNKGISVQEAKQMTQYAAAAAKEVHLTLDFEKAVVANSFNAHRLIQLAKKAGLANEVEEKLFRAHFVEGKNIDDPAVLTEIALAAGIDEKEMAQMLGSDAYETAVREDEERAGMLGIRGVPFFVLNNKYAVSGAQSPEVFLQALQQSWEEFEQEKKPLIIHEGKNCSVDGYCD